MDFPSRTHDFFSKAELWLPRLLTIFLVGLHLIVLTHAGGLWRDEVNTQNLATLPTLQSLFGNLEYDSFPILWFLVLRIWNEVGLGNSDLGLRLLGFVVGISVLGMLWWTVRQFGFRSPMLSLVFFAASPAVMRIGDSLRAYGLGMLFLLFLLGSVWRMLEFFSPGRALLVMVAALLAVQTLYYNSVLFLVICTAASVVCVRRRDYRTLVVVNGIGVIAALSLVPYFGTMQRLQDWNILFKQPIDLVWLLVRFYLAVSSSGNLVFWAFLGALAMLIQFLVYGVFGLSRNSEKKEVVDQKAFLLTLVLLGPVTYFSFLLTLGYPTTDWYYLALITLLTVVLDVGGNLLVQSSSGWKTARLLMMVLIVMALWEPVSKRVQTRQTNMDLVVARLTNMVSRGDLILLTPWWNGITFHRYYHGEASWLTLPDVGKPSHVRYDLVKKRMQNPDPIREVLDPVVSTLRAGGNVWVIGSDFFGSEIFERLSSDPGILPAAPYGKHGWDEYPYAESWAQQAGDCIRSEASRVYRLKWNWKQPISHFENVDVVVACGSKSQNYRFGFEDCFLGKKESSWFGVETEVVGALTKEGRHRLTREPGP